VTPDGGRVGKHTGLMFYTLGQRQGLGIGGTRNGDGDAWYVAEKDMQNNRLVVVQGHDHEKLFTDRLTAVNLNWISGTTPHCGWVYGAKTRYRQKDAPCVIASATQQSCAIEFAEPQWAVTPGQSVVVYESNVCLGGGIIESTAQSAAAAEAIRLRQASCA
jgi:tRNA-specific 2-thiouridylase